MALTTLTVLSPLTPTVPAVSLTVPAVSLTATSGTAAAVAVAEPSQLVNPLIGTSNGGNTFPGADAPFGMVQWSPDTNSRPTGGGYSYNDAADVTTTATGITGFSLTHLSGPGCPVMGDVPIMPSVGTASSTATSTFRHSNESANAGYYKVALDNGVTTELTSTTRSGMAQFTFPSTTSANLVFKLNGGANSPGDPSLTVVDSKTVRGSVSGASCRSTARYTVYFHMVFDQPMTSNGTVTGGRYVRFDTSSNRVVKAKVGVSYVSTANAADNRTKENPNWDFTATRTATQNAWNTLLGKVQITGGTAAQQTTFYTALYHSLLHPNVGSDHNGQYWGFDNRVHTVEPGQDAQYVNFSGWDIYRDQAQLHALLAPDRASDAAQSMVNNYAVSGRIPKWTMHNTETHVMVGDPGAAIIANYYAFGARDFDTSAAKKAMVTQATVTNPNRPRLYHLARKGYVPSDVPLGCCGTYDAPVATHLEYNTSDFAISAFAGALGDTTTQQQFVNRAQAWKNVFNPTTGYVQPRLSNGDWAPNFNARAAVGFTYGGTSLQHTGMVPFNVRGLADAKGGNAAMVSYLDSALASVTGANGAANLTNEPSFVLPWLYTFVGKPYKTQEAARRVQTELWSDGIANWRAGNDDLGAQSAWYVWSAMGLYPVTPGTATLAIGSPVFQQVTVALASGGTFTINAPDAASDAPYVQGLKLDGATYDKAYVPASFALEGGTLDFDLGTTANTSWASSSTSAPPSYAGDGGAEPAIPNSGPITSGVAGTCLDVVKSGIVVTTATQIYTCNGSDAQRWTDLADGTRRAQGMCLDVKRSGTTNGTPVWMWYCNGSGAQKWTFTASTGTLVNPASGKCLTAPGTVSGTQLQISTCNGSAGQRWGVTFN